MFPNSQASAAARRRRWPTLSDQRLERTRASSATAADASGAARAGPWSGVSPAALVADASGPETRAGSWSCARLGWRLERAWEAVIPILAWKQWEAVKLIPMPGRGGRLDGAEGAISTKRYTCLY